MTESGESRTGSEEKRGAKTTRRVKATVYVATSLDGFIARPDGKLDWLPKPRSGSGDASEDYGYRALVDSVDFIVMGRLTYEKVMSFGEWPYRDKPVVVLASQPVEIPDHLASSVEVMSGPTPEIVRRLAERGAKHIYVDGGKTIHRFLEAGLIGRLIISRIPIVLGSGIPLFRPLTHDIRLRHIRSRPFRNGIVQSEYEVVG